MRNGVEAKRVGAGGWGGGGAGVGCYCDDHDEDGAVRMVLVWETWIGKGGLVGRDMCIGPENIQCGITSRLVKRFLAARLTHRSRQSPPKSASPDSEMCAH